MIVYLAFATFIFFAFRLIIQIGKGFPFFELVITLYLLQYVIASHLEYRWNSENLMAVEEFDYLPFALLAILSFAVGLFSIKNYFDFQHFYVPPLLASKLGRVLVLIGILSDVGIFLFPTSFQSAINFFTLFKTIGVYALVFSAKKIDKVFIVVFALQIASSAILNGLLIEFIVFSIFFAMFFAIKYEISYTLKYLFLGVFILFLTVYQGIKSEYRQYVWENEVRFSEKIALLGDLITLKTLSNAIDSNVENNESLIQTIHRLNQGWQTSKVVDHIPETVPYQYGKEFVNDILSSFMPRFLWPDKRVVNDYLRFNYYTGYSLNSRTSMSLGVIGDFYIDFGKIGSCVMMFIFGWTIAKLNKWFFRRYIFTNPINLIWLPFIFSYLIRPGNEFYMVVNHLIKALVVLWFVIKFIYPKLNLMKYYLADYHENKHILDDQL